MLIQDAVTAVGYRPAGMDNEGFEAEGFFTTGSHAAGQARVRQYGCEGRWDIDLVLLDRDAVPSRTTPHNDPLTARTYSPGRPSIEGWPDRSPRRCSACRLCSPRIGERIVNDVAPRDRDIAMVFQNYALYPHMSVHGNIRFPLGLHHVRRRESDELVAQAAELLGIGELLDRRPRHLSGGQRQRVAMGRSIVREPRAFLMDEMNRSRTWTRSCGWRCAPTSLGSISDSKPRPSTSRTTRPRR